MPGDYSEELVELIAEGLRGGDYIAEGDLPNASCDCIECRRRVTRAILDALSSSGRLVPEGSEVREEWTMRYKLNGKPECAEDNGHVFDSREEAVRHIDAWRRFFPALMYSDVEYLRRGGITTPWTPAVDE